MIINRGEIAGIEYLEDRPEAILFVLKNGAYFYAEQGIVENELRVMRNWKIAAAPLAGKQWAIVYSQGDEIPNELGDYLVANQDLPEKALIIKQDYFIRMPPLRDFPFVEQLQTYEQAYEIGWGVAIDECGEILSRPLPVHKEDNHSTGSSKETDD